MALAVTAGLAGTSTGNVAEPGLLVRDVVVSNVDPSLTKIENQANSESVIAVNPVNPLEIVIAASDSNWERRDDGTGPAGVLWYSRDGGSTWSRRESMPYPSGPISGICTCDQVHDFDRRGQLVSVFMGYDELLSASTQNPAEPGAWRWTTNSDGTASEFAVHQVRAPNGVPSNGYVDQPQVVVLPDPLHPKNDVAIAVYNDYGTFSGVGDPSAYYWAATATDTRDLKFTQFTELWGGPVCACTLGAVAGLKVTGDRRTGVAYAYYQVPRAAGFFGPDLSGKQFDRIMDTASYVEHRVTRSSDGGRTWSLGGAKDGIAITRAFNSQSSNKFATFSALYGGNNGGAVDPNDGTFYSVYGAMDPVTKRNRLAIRALTPAGETLTIGPEHFITSESVDAALPAVAVADNGTVGVLFHEFDTTDADGYGIVTTYLTQSSDGGTTWQRSKLITFRSAEIEDGDDVKQRPLGDYHQLKVVGNIFYGTFTANGAAFGRDVDDWDPIFVRAHALD